MAPPCDRSWKEHQRAMTSSDTALYLVPISDIFIIIIIIIPAHTGAAKLLLYLLLFLLLVLVALL